MSQGPRFKALENYRKMMNDKNNLSKDLTLRRSTRTKEENLTENRQDPSESQAILNQHNNPFSDLENQPQHKVLPLQKKEATESDSSKQVEALTFKGATLIRLIERVTNTEHPDPAFQQDFLLTYRSFTNSQQLLNLLIARFNMPPPVSLQGEEEVKIWQEKVLKPIRLRVLNLLKNWVDKHLPDMTDIEALGDGLSHFLKRDIATSFQSAAESIEKILEKKRTEGKEKAAIFLEKPPTPFLAVGKKSTAQMTFLDFHSEEIARQLTLIEHKLYRSIKPWEFFNQGWSKKNKDQTSPHIIQNIRKFNEVSAWVASEIVNQEALKSRIEVLKKFIEVADKCRQHNNFNSLMEILSGLNNSSVYRLKQTWAGLDKKTSQLFEDLKVIIDRNGNFANMRALVKKSDPPTLPYLGLFLTDLTYIEDGNPDTLEGGQINWLKRTRVAKVIKDIQQYQQKPYNLEEVHFLQAYITQYPSLSEGELYKASLERESREGIVSKPATPPAASSPSVKQRDQRKSGFLGFGKKDNKKGTPPPAVEEAKSLKAPSELKEEDDPYDIELEYKQGYQFFEKDSDTNLLVSKDPKGTDPDTVIAGTVTKLVERLTYERYPDADYHTAFMLNFRTFIQPKQLLDLLIQRFEVPPPVSKEPAILERYTMKKQTPIQLRVLSTLKIWVGSYFQDFRTDKLLLDSLLDFIDQKMSKTPLVAKPAETLKQQVQHQLEQEDHSGAKEITLTSEPPAPIIPEIREGESLSLLHLDPQEIARQLTLLDYAAMTKIDNIEYTLYSLSPTSDPSIDILQDEDPDNIQLAPGIVAVIYRFFDVRDWVLTEIVKGETKEQRGDAIQKMIEVAYHCLELKNFQSLFTIITALSFEFVLSLKSSWAVLDRSVWKKFIQLKELVSYKNNYELLRSKTTGLCIPAMPIILKDLNIIKEQLPDTVEPGNLINFAKCQKIGAVIGLVKVHLVAPFCPLLPVESIQEYLANLDIYDISEMKVLAQEFFKEGSDMDIQGTVEEWVQTGIDDPQKLVPTSSPNNNIIATLSSKANFTSCSPAVSSSVPTTAIAVSTISAPTTATAVSTSSAPTTATADSSSTSLGTLSSTSQICTKVTEEHIEETLKQNRFLIKTCVFRDLEDKKGLVFGWSDSISTCIMTDTSNKTFIIPLFEETDFFIGRPEICVALKIQSFYAEIDPKATLLILGKEVSQLAQNILIQEAIHFVKLV